MSPQEGLGIAQTFPRAHGRVDVWAKSDGIPDQETETKMATGVATVWVPVTDMGRAVAFYRDTLGLKVKDQGDDWSEIDANGLLIGLNARETAKVSGGGAVITFQPDGSIEDEVARLNDTGADVTGPISEHPWGRIAPFKDSEGNDLQFYAPPA